jgi:hypothetical protein
MTAHQAPEQDSNASKTRTDFFISIPTISIFAKTVRSECLLDLFQKSSMFPFCHCEERCLPAFGVPRASGVSRQEAIYMIYRLPRRFAPRNDKEV